jgi:diguanylate cyclase (GGDEF)-like protein
VVAMVDLDHFKRVNDQFGHLAGDEALRTFAAAARAATRFYDHAGRYGGEEFLLVLANIPREAVEARVANLHSSISDIEVRLGETRFRITCSIGAAVFDPAEGFARAESLLASADEALYKAKENGRNSAILHDPHAVENEQKILGRILDRG